MRELEALSRAAPGGRPMTLHRLRCFEVTFEERGFKRATARLHVTQPALSYQIKQLEADLGVQLFSRRPGGISPTEAGELLFRHVRRISALVRQAKDAVRELTEGSAGEIRVGTVNSVGIYFLPSLLWAVRTRHPAARPTVLYRDSEGILDALLASRLDLAILADPRMDHRLKYETLFEERVSLVSARSHPLGALPRVRPGDLQRTTFVALSPSTPTGALAAAHLARLGVAVDPVVSSEDVETVKRMVALGMGIAFLPDMVTADETVSDENPGARLVRLPLEPALTRRIVLVTWIGSQPSRAVTAFVEELRSWSGGPPTQPLRGGA
jgi:DNA-binding transcriptional LysR family regulator